MPSEFISSQLMLWSKVLTRAYDANDVEAIMFAEAELASLRKRGVV